MPQTEGGNETADAGMLRFDMRKNHKIQYLTGIRSYYYNSMAIRKSSFMYWSDRNDKKRTHDLSAKETCSFQSSWIP